MNIEIRGKTFKVRSGDDLTIGMLRKLASSLERAAAAEDPTDDLRDILVLMAPRCIGHARQWNIAEIFTAMGVVMTDISGPLGEIEPILDRILRGIAAMEARIEPIAKQFVGSTN